MQKLTSGLNCTNTLYITIYHHICTNTNTVSSVVFSPLSIIMLFFHPDPET